MKVCLIGNSHLAAIKRAWDVRNQDVAGLDFTFFGAAGPLCRDIQHDGACLIAGTPKLKESYLLTAGADTVDLAKFDLFVISGIVFEFRRFINMFREHVLMQHRHLRLHHSILSEAAFRQAVHDFNEGLGRRVSSAIYETTGKPIIFLPAPCPSEEILADETFSSLAENADDPFLEAVYAIYLEEAVAFARDCNADFLKQPAETLRSPGLSLMRYSTGSGEIGWTRKTRGPRVRGNVWHMNAEYGKIVLDELLALIASQPIKGNVKKAMA